MWKQQKAIDGAVYNSLMLVMLTYMYLIQILPPPWLVDIFHNCGGGGLFFLSLKIFSGLRIRSIVTTMAIVCHKSSGIAFP